MTNKEQYVSPFISKHVIGTTSADWCKGFRDGYADKGYVPYPAAYVNNRAVSYLKGYRAGIEARNE